MNDHTWDADSVKDWNTKTTGTGGLVSFGRGENPLRADKLNAAFAERVLRTGDTMTGYLTLHHDPINSFHAATKQYVDGFIVGGTVSRVIVGDTPPPGPANGQMWFDSSNPQLYVWYDDGTSAQWVIATANPANPLFNIVYPADGGQATSSSNPIFINRNIYPPSLPGTPQLYINAPDNTSATIGIDGYGTPPGYGIITFRKSSGVAGVAGALVNNQTLGGMNFAGNDGTSAAFTTPKAGFTAAADAAWSATSTPVRYTFTTTPIGSTTVGTVMTIKASGNVIIGTGIGDFGFKLDVNGGLRASAFAVATTATLTGTSYTLLATDSSLIINPSGTFTLTLGAASGANNGRQIRIKLIAAFAVNSALANVVPQAGGSATTAILAATAGKWCLLQSNGTNWDIMQSN